MSFPFRKGINIQHARKLREGVVMRQFRCVLCKAATVTAKDREPHLKDRCPNRAMRGDLPLEALFEERRAA